MTQRREVLPSARAELEAQAIAAAKKKADIITSQMRQDFTRTFKTESGKRTLAAIYKRSGFGQIILSADKTQGQIDPMATTYAAMELNFYLWIRKLLPIELIQEIEDERRIQPSGTIIDNDTGSTVQRTSVKSRRQSTE